VLIRRFPATAHIAALPDHLPPPFPETRRLDTREELVKLTSTLLGVPVPSLLTANQAAFNREALASRRPTAAAPSFLPKTRQTIDEGQCDRQTVDRTEFAIHPIPMGYGKPSALPASELPAPAIGHPLYSFLELCARGVPTTFVERALFFYV